MAVLTSGFTFWAINLVELVTASIIQLVKYQNIILNLELPS